MSIDEFEWTPLTMSGRHWKWRARGAAVYFAQKYADVLAKPYDLIWCGSFVCLTDLLALCPQLNAIPKVLYFHENQLAYPVRSEFSGPRDHHFGFSQMVSALAADYCVFNSEWNRTSFLEEARRLLKRMPDAKPPNWIDAIEARSSVLHLPLGLPEYSDEAMSISRSTSEPLIIWNHRWEHDKDPETFFRVMMTLNERKTPFRLAVCGETYRQAPRIFAEARKALDERIVSWGYLDERSQYEQLLTRADIAVSTAAHEFFGISMIEAVHFGCRPLVPDRLSYQELFPAEYRYVDETHLLDTLQRLCKSFVGADAARNRSTYRRLAQPFGPSQLRRYSEFIKSALRP
ncbi:MAG: DUF3524 domain-containing protein [Myxococcota bacterium]|nr:DUF3524 domain-containing protein [Myxococcota bacterium]